MALAPEYLPLIPMACVRKLVNPSPEEIDNAVTVIHESFNRQGFFPVLGSEELCKEFTRSLVTASLLDPAGEVWVAEIESPNNSPKFVGVAAWYGPGNAYLTIKKQGEPIWKNLYAAIQKDYQEWWDYMWHEYEGYMARAIGEGATTNNYHLQALGVLEAYRRQGVAKQLLEAVEEEARARGFDTCLETIGDSAVPFYKAIGYEVKEPVLLKAPGDPNSTVPLYAIIKYLQ